MSSLAELEDFIASKGYKQTRSRRSILQALLEKGDWTSARDIYEYVQNRKKIDFSTIYRNLEILTAIGVLCRVERPDAVSYYAFNHAQEHHHHLICKSCQKVEMLDFCPLQQMDPKNLKNFTKVECKFDLYGFCRDCQEKGETNDKK